jgi:hypothetical protein
MIKLARRVFAVFTPVLLCLSADPGADAARVDLTLMMQNLYVGADADVVLSNSTPDTVAAAFQSVVANGRGPVCRSRRSDMLPVARPRQSCFSAQQPLRLHLRARLLVD